MPQLLTNNSNLLQMSVLSYIATSKQIPLEAIHDYFDGQHGRLFDVFWKQWSERGEIDPRVLEDEQKATLQECLTTAGMVNKTTWDELYKYYVARKRAEAINRSQNDEDVVASTIRLQGELGLILLKKQSETYNHTSEISELLKMLEERKLQGVGRVAGIPVNLSKFDDLTNGFERGKFYALGALKKTGKSRFAVYCSIVAAMTGEKVFWNSLEMSSQAINLLALAYFSGINSKILMRSMSNEMYLKMGEAVGSVVSLNWCIYREKTVPELAARINNEKMKKDISLVVVDYIQLMRNESYKADRVREVESIAKDLAAMSKDTDTAVLALSQLRGEAEKLEGDTMPDMRYFKESASIAEAADAIITLHDPNRHESPFTPQGEYVCPTIRCKIEQRFDVSGEVVEFQSDLRTCRFKEVNL